MCFALVDLPSNSIPHKVPSPFSFLSMLAPNFPRLDIERHNPTHPNPTPSLLLCLRDPQDPETCHTLRARPHDLVGCSIVIG